MKQNSLWFLRPLLILSGALAFLLLFVVPVATSYMLRTMEQPPPFLLRNLDTVEWLQTIAVQVITVAMFFFIGACFASFLNVVAWRVPRGRSILGSSACPRCGHRLSFRDNFPVLGWIRNNGHCAHCGTPISARYLVVECLLGAIVLGIVLLTVAGGGVSLPVRTPNSAVGFERVLFEAQWDLIKIAAGQVLLVFALFTFGLVESEGCRIPIRLVAWFGFFVIVASALAPEIHLMPVDWPFDTRWPMQPLGMDHILTLVAGAGVGWGAGWLLDRWIPAPVGPPPAHPLDGVVAEEQGRAAPPLPSEDRFEPIDDDQQTALVRQRDDDATLTPESDIGHPENEYAKNGCPACPGRWVLGLAFAGAILGWQSVPLIAAYSIAIRMLVMQSRVQSLGRAPSFMILGGVLFHLVTWRWMNVLGFLYTVS